MSAPSRVLTQQDLTTEITTGGQAKPVRLQPGDIIGDLRILHQVEPPSGEADPGGRWFLVQCDCGAMFSRRASEILQSARKTVTPCCSACRRRLRKLNHEMNSEEVHFRMRKMFFEKGTLYSQRALDAMEADVMDALEREIGPRRDIYAERELRWGLWIDPTRNESANDSHREREREREIEERHFALRVHEEVRKKNRAIEDALKPYAKEPAVTSKRAGARPTKAPPPPPGPTEVDASFFEKAAPPEGSWSAACTCGSGKMYARCHGRHQPCPCFSGLRFGHCHGAFTVARSK